MSATAPSPQSFTTVSRPSVTTVAVEKLARALLRWSQSHSQVVQLSHEEMALRLANEHVLDEVHEGRYW